MKQKVLLAYGAAAAFTIAAAMSGIAAFRHEPWHASTVVGFGAAALLWWIVALRWGRGIA